MYMTEESDDSENPNGYTGYTQDWTILFEFWTQD